LPLDHPRSPGHHHGRGTKADRTFPGILRHRGELQLPVADRAEQIMIGGENGGREGFIAREDVAGVDLV
jgi:hypothetical protein